jgi:rhodanese-related sulfurtransferase
MSNLSKALATPAADSKAAQVFYQRKLGFETDPADVYSDMKNGDMNYIVLDVRSPVAYMNSYIPGAVNIPCIDITENRMAQYAEDTTFVVYCWGPGCNGATKAALKSSSMGYAVKEMIGGIEYWEDRERYPVDRLSVDPVV